MPHQRDATDEIILQAVTVMHKKSDWMVYMTSTADQTVALAAILSKETTSEASSLLQRIPISIEESPLKMLPGEQFLSYRSKTTHLLIRRHKILIATSLASVPVSLVFQYLE